MRSIRQRISLLKNKIADSLPDDNDVFGYLGISKSILLDSLTESYDLLSTLERYPDKFETVFAKREVAGYIDEAQDYFNTKFHSENAANEFNSLLIAIARIKYVLKDTYISITDNPLRVDYEIAKAVEDLEKLTEILTNVEETKGIIEGIQNSSTEFITELKQVHENSLENEEKINEFVEDIGSVNEKLQGTGEKITLWKSEIQKIEEDISSKQISISKLKTEIDEISETASENQSEIKLQIETLEKQVELNSKHQEQIQKTIEDVSRFGMAGSFKKRKDELQSTQLIWAILTILSLGGLLVISYFIMKPLIDGGTPDINLLFYKIPIFASAVWLGWFCAKQYGFNTRIREDYSYKYAISMAFEGYKNEAKEINPELLEKLLELTILNAARSPERIFNTRTNPGSPYNEMLDSVASHLFGSKKDEPEE